MPFQFEHLGHPGPLQVIIQQTAHGDGPFFQTTMPFVDGPGLLEIHGWAPLAVGEQFGDRWDCQQLIEKHVIDYTRVTVPNVGGITEFMKIAALCETHYIGMIPHFTGPIALAALAHVLAALPVPVCMEIGGSAPQQPPHVVEGCQFHDGKLWPVSRPGLGVAFDPAKAELIAEITERYAPTPMYRRPDGSFTNW